MDRLEPTYLIHFKWGPQHMKNLSKRNLVVLSLLSKMTQISLYLIFKITFDQMF